MAAEGLEHYTAVGQQLLRGSHAVGTHTAFGGWTEDVAAWLNSNHPGSGLSAEWAALPTSNLVIADTYYDEPATWIYFRAAVQARLRWLGGLPEKLRLRKLLTPARVQNEAEDAGRREVKVSAVARAYVDPDRINELKALKQDRFDLARLVRLCEELNICFAAESYLAMILLTRSIIDHVPPVFGCKSFAEVANNYGGTQSFRQAMAHLDASSRKIADHYLHSQVRKSDSLPNAVQVNFSNDLDFLLAEVAAVLR